MSQKRLPVSVKASYYIPTQSSITGATRIFDETNCQEARIGIAEDVVPTKPPNGDYSYSGMHDQGPLPAPKEGGDMALMIDCISEAKKFSDTFLTQVIKDEKVSAHKPSDNGDVSKKQKYK